MRVIKIRKFPLEINHPNGIKTIEQFKFSCHCIKVDTPIFEYNEIKYSVRTRRFINLKEFQEWVLKPMFVNKVKLIFIYEIKMLDLTIYPDRKIVIEPWIRFHLIY